MLITLVGIAQLRDRARRRPAPRYLAPMQVTLPDGSALELQDGATGADAARAIGEGLARVALAVRQNGEVRDLSARLEDGAPLEIVTAEEP